MLLIGHFEHTAPLIRTQLPEDFRTRILKAKRLQQQAAERHLKIEPQRELESAGLTCSKNLSEKWAEIGILAGNAPVGMI
jgi:hypothetical protein